MRGDRSGGYIGGAILAVLVTLVATKVWLDLDDPWWWLIALAVFALAMAFAYRSYSREP